MRLIILDFEYRKVGPGRLEPVCMVAQDLETGQDWKTWLGGGAPSSPPFPCDADTVLVAHGVAIAESRCWEILGWPRHALWIDTFVEEKVLSGGSVPPGGFKLLACLARRGLPGIDATEKSFMRDLIQRGGDHTPRQQEQITDYCASDVTATIRLFRAIAAEGTFDLDQAVFRGTYAAECGRIHQRGLPVDGERIGALTAFGTPELRRLLASKSDHRQVAPGGNWCQVEFSRMVGASSLDWPTTATGRFRSDADTLKEMAKAHGEPWAGLARLKRDLSDTLLLNLDHGAVGRVYCGLNPFRTITGRCAPKTANFLPAKSKWMRSLIQPPPGRSLVSADWSGQEYAIAAALSGDEVMMTAYRTGDPYLAFGKKCGHIPPDGTKQSHAEARGRFKIVSLGVLMGMGADSIGKRTGGSRATGESLLRLHKSTFPAFWQWSDSCENTAAAARPLSTVFGYTYLPGSGLSKPRTARNFLLQATGSDMLRGAVLLLAEAGLEIVMTNHDSITVECDTGDVDCVTALMTACMEDASRICLNNKLTVSVEVERVDFPHHVGHPEGLPFLRRIARDVGFVLDAKEGREGGS
jgi:hypothetical protein